MAAPHCVPVLDRYLASLRDQFEVHEEEQGCFLTTPFYLPDNTRLGVHVIERADGSVEITDQGETFDHLYTSGLNIAVDDTRLESIGKRFGVQIEGGEISKTGDFDAVEESLTEVVHAILDMVYLVYTRRPRAAPSFTAKVEELLIESGQPYETRYEISGLTDSHTFDYHLPSQRNPLLIDTLSATSRQTSRDRSRLVSFKALDTRRLPEASHFRFACLVDDRLPEQQEVLNERVLRTLRGNLDDVLLWSEREKVLELLAA